MTDDSITEENWGGVPVKVFTFGLNRDMFPDDETFQKAQASIEETKRYDAPATGQDFIIPNDKAMEVFRALVDNAKPLGMGFLDPSANVPFTAEMAQEHWDHALKYASVYDGKLEVHYDYVCGRPIKLTFAQRLDTKEWLINTRLYDRDQTGSAAVINAVLEA